MREKFSEGFWSFGINCVLFIGLLLVAPCSNPESNMYIPFIKSQKLWFYISLIGLFVIQQAMVRWPKLASLGDVNNLKDIIDVNLKNILKNYHSEVLKINSGTQGHPRVNVNIMLPTRSQLKRKFLKIYYYYPAYPENEIELKWKSGEGTCGYAWAKKREAIFDSVNRNYKAPEKRLKPHHIKVVENITSVLSIPIWDRQSKELIGVLNLDSKGSNIDKTYFDKKEIIQSIEARARKFLSPLLESFYDGVIAQ